LRIILAAATAGAAAAFCKRRKTIIYLVRTEFAPSRDSQPVESTASSHRDVIQLKVIIAHTMG
jgi:hypothetical protein